MTAEPMRLRCVCGWETTGTEEEVIAAATEHGERVHNMRPTRDEVLAMVIEDTSSSIRTAERLYQALEEDDIPRFLELCAEDVSVHYPAETHLPYGGIWEGRDGVARFLDTHDEAEEILTFDVHRMLAEGDTVIVLGHFAGRAKPTGREWSTDFVHTLTVTDGLLHRWVAFFDTAAAFDARA